MCRRDVGPVYLTLVLCTSIIYRRFLRFGFNGPFRRNFVLYQDRWKFGYFETLEITGESIFAVQPCVNLTVCLSC